MQVILDIKGKKGLHLLDVIKDLPYVKITPFTGEKISNEKALLIKEIKEAVEELNLIKKGKLKGTPAKQLLDEL